MRALRRILSAANSPWLWPIAPLLAIVAVGQWGGATAAGGVAAACGAIGIGILIGLTMAGDRGARRALRLSQEMETPAAESPAAESPAAESPETQLRHASPGEMLAETGEPVSLRAADLRGARLARTRLVGADLRRADLRGATLTGADLTDADLTDALLGPLEDSQEGRAQP